MFSLRIEGLGRLKDAEVAGRLVPSEYEVHLTPKEAEPRPGLVISFRVEDGVPQCSEVRVTRSPHGREVQRSDVREVVIEEWIEDATEYVSRTFDRAEVDSENARTIFHYAPPDETDYRLAVRKVRAVGKRRGPTDAELREALEIYEATNHAPTKAVADHFEIKHRTASLWVSRARKLKEQQ